MGNAKIIWLACLAAAALLIGGCAANLPPIGQNSGVPPVYRLAAGDRLSVTVFGEEALSREYVVTSAGDISFPLLGDLPAAGRDPLELSRDLTARLSDGYLNDPRVNIEVLNYRPLYILGEVTRSGEYAYRPEMTALQAIALAGGYTYRADRRRLFILRAGESQELTYEVSSQEPVYVMPGDTIRIGERFF